MPHALADLVRQRTLNISLLIYPQVEILDFAGPYEVFSVASRVALRDGVLPHAAFRVQTVAAEPGQVCARYNLHVAADASLQAAAPCDVLIVPGGVVDQPLGHPPTLAWVASTAARTPLVTSVCTGAFILAKAGVLTDHTVTTHWDDIAQLQQDFPALKVVADVPYVDLGALVTSAGISAGIDMSLHVVARILDGAVAKRTARQMQYEWTDRA
ncbi:thij/pfpi domain-containing protein [Pseudomonas sp. M47T1]|uniref:DJ-1/PfpI family protein n=1 Tax=unclassified Pseudomonas TaxID=196821 RepID=UPI0002607812|nr:DJ-1/PfpI family protein [Pseudomonas sp. M47T1]EIK97660.1 thij/pfpi domain-containing protein [Pseudomonas sp. M47T1]